MKGYIFLKEAAGILPLATSQKPIPRGLNMNKKDV
jgi:hypothetical protein